MGMSVRDASTRSAGDQLKLRRSALEGAVVVSFERAEDDRGFFVRTYDQPAFSDAGIEFRPIQCSLSFNVEKGALRGLHWQAAPHEEAKLVQCTKGAIFDVIVDLRAESSSYGKWESFELRAEDTDALFVPPGFAHGFQTLEDASEVSYMISAAYVPEAARGIRWDDPTLSIDWPLLPRSLSDRDKSFVDFVW